MLTTLVLLCAQTPVQHELDLIPFEHLINHKREAEKMREERLALDLLALVAGKGVVPDLSDDASFSSQLAAGFFNMAVEGLVESEILDRPAMEDPRLWPYYSGVPRSHGPFFGSQDVLDSIKTYMVPAFDSARESLKVDQTGNGRVLLAYLQPSQSEWLHEFFTIQEETETWTALISAHIFIGGSEWLDANGFEDRATPFLEAEVMGKIVKGLSASCDEEMVSPRILTNPGMEGSLSVLTEISYVEKWEVRTVQPGDVTVVDPMIETVEEGLTMKVRVLQVADDQYGVSISYELMDLMHPMKTSNINLAGVNCRSATPEVITTSLDSNLVIPSGGGAVFRTTRSSDQKEIVLVLQLQRVKVKNVSEK